MNQHSQRHSRTGFTLLELMAVITIIVILATLAIRLAQYGTSKGMESRAKAEIQALSAAIQSYKQDKGFYPPDNTTAVAPCGAAPANANSALYIALSGNCAATGRVPTAGNTAYFTSFREGKGGNVAIVNGIYQIIDPYGNQYNYRPYVQNPYVSPATVNSSTVNTSSFDLWSNGPNGSNDNGSSDDISNFNP